MLEYIRASRVALKFVNIVNWPLHTIVCIDIATLKIQSIVILPRISSTYNCSFLGRIIYSGLIQTFIFFGWRIVRYIYLDFNCFN